MAYTDGDVIIEGSVQVISEVIQEMEEVTNDTGHKINVDKTKYRNTSKWTHKSMQLETQNVNEDYQEVSQFIYLGLLVTYDHDCGKDVWAGITADKWSCHSLSKIMKSKCISEHTKLKI